MTTNDSRSDLRRSPSHTTGLVAGAILLVALIALAIDNRDDTRVGFVVGDTSTPLFVVIVIAAAAGAIIGWLVLHRPRSRHG